MYSNENRIFKICWEGRGGGGGVGGVSDIEHKQYYLGGGRSREWESGVPWHTDLLSQVKDLGWWVCMYMLHYSWLPPPPPPPEAPIS